MSDIQDRISVDCACGKKLKAPASAVGRKARCPSCGSIVTLTAPPPPPSDDQAWYDDPQMAYRMAEDEAAAATEASAQSEVRSTADQCPNCLGPMDRGAKLCTNCGYHIRTGKVMPIATASVIAASDDDADSSAGSWRRGLILSIIGGAAAGLVWLIAAFAARGEYYLLLLLIGVAAGAGMQLGRKAYDQLAGLMSSGVTLVMTIAARTLVIALVVIPMTNGSLRKEHADKVKAAEERAQREHDQAIEQRDSRVAQLLAQNALRSAGIDLGNVRDEDEKSDAKLMQAEEQASRTLKTMNSTDYLALLPKAREMETRSVLIARMMDPQLRKMGLNPDFQRIHADQYQAASKAVLVQVNNWTPAQHREELKKLSKNAVAMIDEEFQAARDREQAVINPKAVVDPLQTVGGMGAIFDRLVAFGPIVVMLLAMMAGYGIGAGGWNN